MLLRIYDFINQRSGCTAIVRHHARFEEAVGLTIFTVLGLMPMAMTTATSPQLFRPSKTRDHDEQGSNSHLDLSGYDNVRSYHILTDWIILVEIILDDVLPDRVESIGPFVPCVSK